MGNFYIEYENSSGIQTQEFSTGALLKTFIANNKSTFINHCKVVAKLPEITDMRNMFSGCSSLTSIDLSNFNTSKVTAMFAMFLQCSSLTSLNLSNFDTSSVTDMRYMFYECSSLTSIDLSNFDTSSVTSMYYMFYNCSNLITLYCNDDWSGGVVSSSNSMFDGCTSLVGAISHDSSKIDVAYANPTTGYFTVKELVIYFDDVLINKDSYTYLNNDFQIFTDSFKLGSVASNSFKLRVARTAVSSHPSSVLIEDNNTTFPLVVDMIEEDRDFYIYTLTDKLVDFNFDYDASVLINQKAELEEDCYLSDIWKDMCLQANVEYDETYVFENDIVVTWYDSRIQARKYLSFIAELQSGYACMLENGKQSFKPYKKASSKTIDIDECSDFIVGEKKTITRVVFDGGAFKWEFGDETGDTLYLQSDNVFIVNEQIVENIYNNIKDFEFYLVDVPNAPMDSSTRAGDVITFDDNGKLYPTIAQYSMSYGGGWTGGYQLKVNTTKQQETQVARTADNVRNIQVNVDRLNNEFGIIAEEIEKLTDYIRNVGTIGNYLKLPDTPRSGGAINKLSIKGFELMPLYPGMAYPSENTYPGALSFYTLIFDTAPTFDNEPNYIFINSPVPLNKLGDVYDEILIEANKIKVIQRIGYDFVNEQWSVLSTPITHELNDVLLPTFESDTYVTAKYFDNLIYDAEYLVKNDLTSNFATQLESSSQFNLNSNQAVLKVDSQGNVVEAKLSADANTGSRFNLKADNIALEGYTTINNGFSVDLNGNATMNNAEIKGAILKLADNTNIVGGNGILSQLQYKSGFDLLGINEVWYSGIGFVHGYLVISCYIPDNFTIRDAYLTLTVFNTENLYYGNIGLDPVSGYGRVRNIKIFKQLNESSWLNSSELGWYQKNEPSGTEISGVFGENGYTNETSGEDTITTSNIAQQLNKGLNTFFLKTTNPLPNAETIEGVTEAVEQSQFAEAIITVIGFTK